MKPIDCCTAGDAVEHSLHLLPSGLKHFQRLPRTLSPSQSTALSWGEQPHSSPPRHFLNQLEINDQFKRECKGLTPDLYLRLCPPSPGAPSGSPGGRCSAAEQSAPPSAASSPLPPPQPLVLRVLPREAFRVCFPGTLHWDRCRYDNLGQI